MRTIYTLVFFLTALAAFAQDTTLTTVASLHMPKGIRAIGSKDVEKVSRQYFKTQTKPFSNGRSFTYDGLLISIHEMSFDEKHEKTLEKLKREYDGAYAQVNASVDASRIENFNGNNFLIFEYHLNEDHTINFVSETLDHKNISGFIKFNASDRDKAYKFLKELLVNIKLKGRRR